VAETIGLTSVLAGGPLHLNIQVAATLPLADSLARQYATARILAAALPLADTLTRGGIGRVAGITATLGLVDVVTLGATGQSRSLAEHLGLVAGLTISVDTFQRPGYVVFISHAPVLIRPGSQDLDTIFVPVPPGSIPPASPGRIRR
jgi:hypothetical protein